MEDTSLASGISIPMENLLILYILQDHLNKDVNFSVQIGKCLHGVLNCSIPEDYPPVHALCNICTSLLFFFSFSIFCCSVNCLGFQELNSFMNNL